jgi:nucleotide sugar dehydrogenase
LSPIPSIIYQYETRYCGTWLRGHGGGSWVHPRRQKFIVDPKHNSTNTIEDLIKFKPDAVFVAVPTPQLESGECNTTILEDVMRQLNNSKGLLVIVKSTVPAYKLQNIKEQCVDLRIVYNPEFLTEKNYMNDFVNPPMHVFGGINADTDAVEKLYRDHSACAECPVFKTDLVTASMVKYCINSFLATKVTFMNEMYDVLKAARGTDWNTFSKIIRRIHAWATHTSKCPAMTDSVATRARASPRTPPHWHGSHVRS